LKPFIYQAPADEGLDIIYEDDYLLVLNKPCGLLSVPGKGEDRQDCMISRAQAEFPDALIVHRLDMFTSGLIILALNRDIHRQLSLLFQNRQVIKQYVAEVDGLLEQDQGLIDLPLITDWPNRPRQIVDQQQGKPSQTQFEVLSRNPDLDTSRVKLTPVTGRTHQIRVHLQAINHPVLGDRLYASESAQQKAARLMLHAEYLELTHPVSEKRQIFICPSPF
jgi:tRNA pseudouridine32 synthase/23S rRNA pseudouridine746 synthase